MGNTQKFIAGTLWALLVAVMVGVIGAGLLGRVRGGATDAAPPRVYDSVPPFSMVDQDGRGLSDRDLLGHVWVCDFVFTNCAGPCRLMSEKMVALQKSIQDPAVRFVSFSVDPQRDTPEQLKQYAAMYNPGETRWSLVTDKPADKSADKPATAQAASATQAAPAKSPIYDLARGFLLTAIPAGGDEPILHDERFVLVDAGGKVRGYYHVKDAEKMKRLSDDVETLSAPAPGKGNAP